MRTKSGRLVEKLVYVSKSDYDKIKSGDLDQAKVMEVLPKYAKPGDGKMEGWGEAEMKAVSCACSQSHSLSIIHTLR